MTRGEIVSRYAHRTTSAACAADECDADDHGPRPGVDDPLRPAGEPPLPTLLTRRAILVALLLAGPTMTTDARSAEEAAGVDETIIVYGERDDGRLVDSAVGTEIIDRAAIERTGGRTVADVLETTSGVSVERDFGGAGASLLGLDPRYTLVLVDGERVIGQVDGAFDLDRIPVEHIERIEIIRGAASAAYGADGVGGVIDIITRRPAGELDGDARLGGATDSGFSADGAVGGGLGPVKLRLSAGFDRAPAYDLDPSDPATSGSAENRGRGRLRAAFEPAERVRVHSVFEYELRARDGVDSSSVAVYDRRQSTESVGGGLGVHWFADGAGSARLRVDHLRDQYLLDQRGGREDSDEDTRLLRVGLDLRHGWSLGDDHRLSAGIDGEIEDASSPRLAGGEGREMRGAVFVEDAWRLLDGEPIALEIVGGLRLDADGDGRWLLCPRIATRVDPFEGLAIRASAGIGRRAPDFKERLLRFENPAVGYIVEGNPDLIAEEAYTAQVGISWRPTSAVEVYSDAARAHIDDQIVIGDPIQDGDRARYRYVNVAEALTHSLESGARLTVGAHRVGFGYRFTDARDLAADAPLPGRDRHRGHMEYGVQHEATGLGLDTRVLWVGERPIVEEDGTQRAAAPYTDLNARAQWQATEALALFALGENLLDAGDHVDLPLRPRRVTLGVTGRL